MVDIGNGREFCKILDTLLNSKWARERAFEKDGLEEQMIKTNTDQSSSLVKICLPSHIKQDPF